MMMMRLHKLTMSPADLTFGSNSFTPVPDKPRQTGHVCFISHGRKCLVARLRMLRRQTVEQSPSLVTSALPERRFEIALICAQHSFGFGYLPVPVDRYAH